MEPTQSPTQEPIQPLTPVAPKNKPNLTIVIFVILIVISIGIAALLFFQNQKLQKQVLNPQVSPTIQVPSPTSKPSSSISIPADETVNWKTYIGSKYLFKYPAEFGTISEMDLQTRLMKGMGYVIEVKRIATTSNLTDWLINEKKNGQFPDSDWTSTVTHFADKPALFLQSHYEMQTPGDMYAIRVNDAIYTIFFDKEESLKTIVNQILSTFKFINDTSVCIPTYQIETNTSELTAKQNYSMLCTEQRSEKDCLSIDLYNKKADDFSIPDEIPDCIWKNPTK